MKRIPVNGTWNGPISSPIPARKHQMAVNKVAGEYQLPSRRRSKMAVAGSSM